MYRVQHVALAALAIELQRDCCFGKSSGGYGAIIHGMKSAKHRGATADQSDDARSGILYHALQP